MGNLLTVAAAAVRMSVAEKTVYRWFWNGDLAGVKLGRCVRICEDSLNAFLEAHKNVKPTSAAAPATKRPPPRTAAVYRYLMPPRSAA